MHPYYVGTQAHPEFKSRPTAPHPLFGGLVGAALAQSRRRLLEDGGAGMTAAARPSRSTRPVLASRITFPGRVWDVRTDDVRARRTGTVVTATSCATPAPSGCIALDEDDRVLLVRQYRHPVGMCCGSRPPACSTSPASRRC